MRRTVPPGTVTKEVNVMGTVRLPVPVAVPEPRTCVNGVVRTAETVAKPWQ
jgi:hypothetical protein